MSNTVVVKVKVQELSKYGYKANGEYIGLSKNLKDADKARLVPGAEFEAEYFVADSGKQYLNKILGTGVPSVSVPKAPTTEAKPNVDVERAKVFTPKFQKKETSGENMTRADWDAKDIRISRQGVIQAATIALAPVVSLEKLPSESEKLANFMLAFVNQTK